MAKPWFLFAPHSARSLKCAATSYTGQKETGCDLKSNGDSAVAFQDTNSRRRGRKTGDELRFRVRGTPDWKEHAANLEAEMLKRGMFYNLIDSFEGQGKLPLD